MSDFRSKLPKLSERVTECQHCRTTVSVGETVVLYSRHPEGAIDSPRSQVVCMECADKLHPLIVAEDRRANADLKYTEELHKTLMSAAEHAVLTGLAGGRSGSVREVPDPDILLEDLLTMLGGHTGAARLFVLQLVEAMRRNPGSRTTLQAIKWVFDALEASARRKLQASRYAQMSDEEIEKTIKQLLASEADGQDAPEEGEKDESPVDNSDLEG